MTLMTDAESDNILKQGNIWKNIQVLSVANDKQKKRHLLLVLEKADGHDSANAMQHVTGDIKQALSDKVIDSIMVETTLDRESAANISLIALSFSETDLQKNSHSLNIREYGNGMDNAFAIHDATDAQKKVHSDKVIEIGSATANACAINYASSQKMKQRHQNKINELKRLEGEPEPN